VPTIVPIIVPIWRTGFMIAASNDSFSACDPLIASGALVALISPTRNS
jgi:hypothetical protein